MLIEKWKIKKLMEKDFTPDLCRKLADLSQFRISKVRYYKFSASDEIDNWAGHKSRDDFDNRARQELVCMGISVLRRRVRAYDYFEFQTEHFRFIQKMISSSYPFEETELTGQYILSEPENLLFPEYETQNNDSKYPAILLIERSEDKYEIENLSIKIRAKGLWLEDLTKRIELIPNEESEAALQVYTEPKSETAYQALLSFSGARI